MHRFKNILAVFEGDARGEVALERAAILAKHNEARLTVVEVIPPLPVERLAVFAQMVDGDLREFVIDQHRRQLTQFTQPVRQQGISGNDEVLVGAPFLEIIRAVLRNQHDLVVLAADGIDQKGWLFGSTSMHLLRKCPCPVWVVKPTQGGQYRRILAAVDLDPDDESKNQLTIKIMDLATSMARLEQSVLYFVHAWTTLGEDLMRSRGPVPRDQLEDWLREDRAARERLLEALLRRYSLEGLDHHVRLFRGEAELWVPRFADEERVDLVIMGTVSRTGIAGYFIGNTAESILQRLNCSVLTVKPDGFVSPVTL